MWKGEAEEDHRHSWMGSRLELRPQQQLPGRCGCGYGMARPLRWSAEKVPVLQQESERWRP